MKSKIGNCIYNYKGPLVTKNSTKSTCDRLVMWDYMNFNHKNNQFAQQSQDNCKDICCYG
jgi:hypothetical protein